MVSVSPWVRQRVAAGEELVAQLDVVVDLAVLGDLDRAVLVRQRLAAGVEVDDREPPGPERSVPSSVNTRCSSGPRWASVSSMAFDQALVVRAQAVDRGDARDAAHG